MASYKTRGIIIKRSNFGEADRLVTIFTQNHGKVRAIAKGSRKPLSKLAGHLELFCLDNFLIAEGRNLDIISGAQVEKCFFELRNHLERTHTAYYFAEIIDKMSGENEAHPDIFNLLEEVLENLNSTSSELLIPYFELNILSSLGYTPELYKCVECSQILTDQKNSFSNSAGGLVCHNCKKSDLSISNDTIKIVRLLLKHDLETIKKIKVNSKQIQQAKKLTGDYLKYIHQQEFRSRRFIHE